MRRYLLGTMLIWAGAGADAAARTVDCTVQNQINQVSVVTKSGSLDDAGGSIELTGLGLRGDIVQVADISLSADGRVAIHLGDFCGEQFHDIEVAGLGSGIHDVLSYGPNAKGDWQRLVLDCAYRRPL